MVNVQWRRSGLRRAHRGRGGAPREALRLVNLLAAALVAGGQLLVLLAAIPVKRSWEPELSVRLHRDLLTVLPDRYLRPLTLVAFGSGLLLLVLGRPLRTLSSACMLAGLVGTIVAGLASVLVEFPINRQVLEWSATAVPPEYPTIRDRWDRGHAVRTASGVLTLLGFVLAALTSAENVRDR